MHQHDRRRGKPPTPDIISMSVLGAGEAKPAYFDISLILKGFARDGITAIANNLRTAGMEQRKGELIPLTECALPVGPTQNGSSPTVYDIAANRVAEHPQLVKGTAQLMKNCAVPYAERIENQDARIFRSGLWFVPKPSEIKKTLQYEGAQVLTVIDSNKRLWGAVLYDTNVNFLANEDKTLCLKIAARLKIKPEELGYVNVVVVDPEIEKPVSDGGLGISRKEAYIAMHTLMVGEAAAKGVKYLISYVWEGHFTNAAMKTHAALGWKKFEGKICDKLKRILLHSYTDPSFGAVVDMHSVPVVLETGSLLQRKIAATRPLQKSRRVDLDQG